MPRKTVYQASIDFLQILDEEGRLDAALAKDSLSDGEIKSLYEKMIVCRLYDEAAVKLQRSGRLGTWCPSRGHEAGCIGAARALRKGHDYIIPYYREVPALYQHGMPLHLILLRWMGDERGNILPPGLCIMPSCVSIGMQLLHAAGIAWAFKLRKEDRVAMCFFGEGATSEGDFHEGLNFASVLQVPAVFSCVNNNYAISTPTVRQSGSQTMAQKALAYGMPTIQVDGNDLLASYVAHRDAVKRAREGGGPQFVEMVTYRLGDHTTADDARRYRPADEYAAALGRDPLIRTRKYLESIGIWNEQEEQRAQASATATVHEICKLALDIKAAPRTDMFDYTFAQIPERLARQRNTLRTSSIGQEPGQVGLRPPVENVPSSQPTN